MVLNTVQELVADIRAGKMVILMDDEERENEGDLIIAADCATAEHINFFVHKACGLVCLALEQERADQLGIGPMVRRNISSQGTNFTVSIEAAEGVSTGISAADRAHTIRTAMVPDADPTSIVSPGHVFPLIARPGGVLTRAGHTEAGCDMARLAGKSPAAVIVEIMNEDGSMARQSELLVFAEQHNIKIGTIADLIKYRAMNDKTVECIDVKEVTAAHAKFNFHVYRDTYSGAIYSALVHGDISSDVACLVRVQTVNIMRDVLQIDHDNFHGHWSLSASLQYIAEQGLGVVVVVGQEEHSDEEMLETIKAFPDIPTTRKIPKDRQLIHAYRTLGAGCQILKSLGVGKMRLMGGPAKFTGLSGFNLEITEFIANPA